MWLSHWHIEKWWARQESQKAHNYLADRLHGSQTRRGVILVPLLGPTVSHIILMWEENMYILTGFWALPSTAKGVLWRITSPNGHKILKNGLKRVLKNQCDALQPRQIHSAVTGATLEPDVQRQKREWLSKWHYQKGLNWNMSSCWQMSLEGRFVSARHSM